jgi:hypothetical protein
MRAEPRREFMNLIVSISHMLNLPRNVEEMLREFGASPPPLGQIQRLLQIKQHLGALFQRGIAQTEVTPTFVVKPFKRARLRFDVRGSAYIIGPDNTEDHTLPPHWKTS